MDHNAIVYCINPGCYPLTAGKTYEVILRDGEWILLRGDSGYPGSYYDARFKALEEMGQQAAREAA
jgi:hypothetical protein